MKEDGTAAETVGIGLVSDDCQVDALLARKAWAPEAGHRHARTVVRVIVPSGAG